MTRLHPNLSLPRPQRPNIFNAHPSPPSFSSKVPLNTQSQSHYPAQHLLHHGDAYPPAACETRNLPHREHPRADTTLGYRPRPLHQHTPPMASPGCARYLRRRRYRAVSRRCAAHHSLRLHGALDALLLCAGRQLRHPAHLPCGARPQWKELRDADGAGAATWEGYLHDDPEFREDEQWRR